MFPSPGLAASPQWTNMLECCFILKPNGRLSLIEAALLL